MYVSQFQYYASMFFFKFNCIMLRSRTTPFRAQMLYSLSPLHCVSIAPGILKLAVSLFLPITRNYL